jgi:hypothetical protein
MPLVCNCLLAGTEACKSCPEYIRYFGVQNPNNVTITWPLINPIQPPITPKKVIEEYEYDREGRIIKKTITESTT